MSALGVDKLLAERQRFMATIESLSDDEFDHGRTLCAAWAPRDVLAHLVGTASLVPYVAAGLRVNSVNKTIVDEARSLSRPEITARGNQWAEHPSPSDRLGARFLIGDVAVHHQDVLRGLGRSREIPVDVGAAIFHPVDRDASQPDALPDGADHSRRTIDRAGHPRARHRRSVRSVAGRAQGAGGRTRVRRLISQR